MPKNSSELSPSWLTHRSNEQESCVEVAVWNTSGIQGNSLEIQGAVIGVRDSKNPGGSILTFTPTEWRTFLATLHSN